MGLDWHCFLPIMLKIVSDWAGDCSRTTFWGEALA